MPQPKRIESALTAELNATNDASFRHRMQQILESLDESEREALERVLDRMHAKNLDKTVRTGPLYSYRWLAETLTKHGHPIKKNQVRHYMVFLYAKDRGVK